MAQFCRYNRFWTACQNKSIVEGGMFIPRSMGHDSIHRIKYTLWRRHTRHVRTKRRPVKYCTVERLDQGHLYPLGRRRDKHVTGGARTSAPLQSRRTLYLKSYLDSLYAGYSEHLLGHHQWRHSVLYRWNNYFSWRRKKNILKVALAKTIHPRESRRTIYLIYVGGGYDKLSK